MKKPNPRTAEWQMAAVDMLSLNVYQMFKAAGISGSQDWVGVSSSGERPGTYCSTVSYSVPVFLFKFREWKEEELWLEVLG